MLKYADIEEVQEDKVIEMREEYTYGAEISVEDETKIEDLIKTCKEMVDVTKEIVLK